MSGAGSVRWLGTSGLSCHAAPCRMPRNRPPAASIWRSSTPATASPSSSQAVPTIPAAMRVGPYCPELAHRRDAGGELRLPDRAKLIRAAGLEHRSAFDEHRRDDVVTACQVLQKLVEEIARRDAVAAKVPQVMVRIADWQLRFERRLDGACQPVVVGRHRDLVLLVVCRGSAYADCIRDDYSAARKFTLRGSWQERASMAVAALHGVFAAESKWSGIAVTSTAESAPSVQ